MKIIEKLHLCQHFTKVYMGVLAERLRKEVEGKGMIPVNQTGFRKGFGTLDKYLRD